MIEIEKNPMFWNIIFLCLNNTNLSVKNYEQDEAKYNIYINV